MEIILYLLSFTAGATICFFFMRTKVVRHLTRAEMQTGEIDDLQTRLRQALTDLEHRSTERLRLAEQLQNATTQNDFLRQQLQDETRRHAAEKEELAQRRRRENEESERLWQTRLNALQQEFQKTAAEQLNAKQNALQEGNRRQIDQLLQPLKEEFAAFKQSVEQSRTQGELNKEELKSTFETTLKLFEQQQRNAVEILCQQTDRIGNDAAQLTQALKGDNKLQGDWGEMILSTMLENCGLRKDQEYFVQQTVKDSEGRVLRPDVVVRFPEGRSVVIDSKVSLTSYAAATAALDDTERQARLKDHVASLRRHVDELAAKDYSRLVDGTIGFVLMFVPNENSYIAAMQQDPALSQDAYKKQVIIISPGNLLMALKLAYHLWQYDRQTKNVAQIVQKAGVLYDKVASFSETFSDIETQTQRLVKSLEKAKTQLYAGRGNLMRQTEQLRELGVTPRKQIKADALDEPSE